MMFIAACFDKILSNPAISFPVLGFQASRLDIHLFDESQVNACRKRPIVSGPDTNPAEASIRDVHAVSYVLVLEPAPAANRRICFPGAPPVFPPASPINPPFSISLTRHLILQIS